MLKIIKKFTFQSIIVTCVFSCWDSLLRGRKSENTTMFCEQFSVQYEKNIYKKPLHTTRFAKLKQKNATLLRN